MKKIACLFLSLVLFGCSSTPNNERRAEANNCISVISKISEAEENNLIPATELLPIIDSCVAFSASRGAELSALSYGIKGRYHSMRGEHDLAVSAYEKMFEIAPYKKKSMWDNVSLASAYRDAKQYDKSLATLERALKNNPPTMPIFYNMAQTYYQMGNYSKVVETIGLGLPYQKDYSWAYWYRGLAYEKLGKKDLAKEDFVVVNALRAADYKANPKSFNSTSEKAKRVRAEVNTKLKSYTIELGVPNE